MTLVRSLNKQVRPSQEELARVGTPGHTEDNLHLYFFRAGLFYLIIKQGATDTLVYPELALLVVDPVSVVT
jgi:hypothetical protein